MPLRLQNARLAHANAQRARGQFPNRTRRFCCSFGAHVAVASRTRGCSIGFARCQVFGTLADIAREMSSILDLDELLSAWRS